MASAAVAAAAGLSLATTAPPTHIRTSGGSSGGAAAVMCAPAISAARGRSLARAPRRCCPPKIAAAAALPRLAPPCPVAGAPSSWGARGSRGGGRGSGGMPSPLGGSGSGSGSHTTAARGISGLCSGSSSTINCIGSATRLRQPRRRAGAVATRAAAAAAALSVGATAAVGAGSTAGAGASSTAAAAASAATGGLAEAAAVALGYAVLLGSLFRSAPQIAKVVRARSCEGLSLTSVVVELLCYSVVVAYNVSQGYAFNTFGEVAACWVQDVVLIALILRFSRAPGWAIGAVFGCLAALSAWLLSPACPRPMLAALQASTILTMALGSRLPQIILNWRRGNAGVLSVTSCGLNVAGNAARVFTTLVLTRDPLLLGGILTQGTMNAVLLWQSIDTSLRRRAGLLPPAVAAAPRRAAAADKAGQNGAVAAADGGSNGTSSPPPPPPPPPSEALREPAPGFMPQPAV